MKIYHYILFILVTLLASCSSDLEQGVLPPAPEDFVPTCGIVVSLVTDTPVEKGNPDSRAGDTWNDPYDYANGSTLENFIGDVYMYVVTPDNKVLPLSVQLYNIEEGAREYKVTLKLGESYATPTDRGTYLFTGRIVALVNYKGAMPVSPFENVVYDISEIENGGYLPMWGVTGYNNVEVRPDGIINGGTIKLLRALPKLTFELSDNIKDIYKITSVSSPRNDFNLSGHGNPTGGESVLSTSSLSIEGCFNPFEANKGVSPSVIFNSPIKTTIYLPEMVCEKDKNGRPPYYDVTIDRKDGTGLPISGKVYLCDYQGGSPVFGSESDRLVRNHDYQYVIDLAELSFSVSFREWIFGGKVHIELE